MEIKESERWNKFSIPIPKKDEETSTEYLSRVQKILTTFYERHTSYSNGFKNVYSPFRDRTLESLVLEHNFCSIGLSGINYCDVKFAVGTPEQNYGTIGIDVWSHGDNVEIRKPMVDFVKELWRNFSQDI